MSHILTTPTHHLEPGDLVDAANILAWVLAEDSTVGDEQAIAEARDLAVEVQS